MHGDDARALDGAWVGLSHERGHRLRGAAASTGAAPVPALQRRCAVIVVGAGVAGLAAARALTQAGIDDVHVFDVEDGAGGNSRGLSINGLRCPLGAHYLPVPDEDNAEAIELLEAFGVRSTRGGRAVYDERHLVHSPQERLHVGGQWVEGLLPPVEALPLAERASTTAQYARFSREVDALRAGGRFRIPTASSRWDAELEGFDAITFATWLDRRGYDAPALRWYLDYCCRDDYGAGAATVSAWAGLHYFASRHGFRDPGAGEGGETGEGVLTWPEGNAWLVERMAAPLGARLHAGCVALRIDEGRHAVDVDLWNVAASRVERWTAAHVVTAVPLFVARRIVVEPPPALVAAAAALQYAPWLVVNVALDAPLDDVPGAPPSWDNVVYGSSGLGYVDAGHQSMRPVAERVVLTAYRAFGDGDAAQRATARSRLLAEPWQPHAAALFAEWEAVHPDLQRKARQVRLMRYGHAMSIPVPGVRSSPALAALAAVPGRVQFAHGDLAGYSIFEEALHHGRRAARAVSAARAVAAV
ncbi:FAD-dependent oxidoreductase [Schlegelella sp. ID0723]|uniref:FAD-dependent oxidoreductase n=1 Tax=Piscinibacter koreensis TaxID=2742824 RepID=A0A7Y6TV45_9BURK|nr:FAD-dependent oxidoreductase [Schlegelella koreensis]NUZ04638.1 FAD-dependent oxidoreductase [Schlegelella koreensis]